MSRHMHMSRHVLIYVYLCPCLVFINFYIFWPSRVVGHVAVSGKHLWVFSDQQVVDSSSSSEV